MPIYGLAVVGFLAGTWLSFRTLGLSLATLDRSAIAAVIALLPFAIFHAGLGLVLLAQCAGVRIPLGRACFLAGLATLSEALPIPGGAIVRAGALVTAGASAGRSSFLVVLTAVFWISLAALGCGLSMAGHHSPVAWPLLAGGGGGTIVTVVLLIRTAGAKLALETIFHRLAGIALIAWRLHFVFLAIGVPVSVIDTLPFALANIAGAAASLAPAGLGISEGLAALVAASVSVAPAAAFIAVGFDRLASLVACAVVTLVGTCLRTMPTHALEKR